MVNGGTSHSSDTYDELGVEYNHAYQKGSNHPVITTYFNICNFSQKIAMNVANIMTSHS